MNKGLISNIWQHRKAITEIVTTGVIIGKGIVDFARKDGIGKLFALAELGVGIGAAAIHTGAADKVVNIVAERAAEEDYRRYPPEPYEGLSPEGPDPYDSEYDDYDHDEEDYDSDVDEDGFNTVEFDKFINSGEYPESEEDSLEAEEEDDEGEPDEEAEE